MLNNYEVTVFRESQHPQCVPHIVKAHSAQDAAFEVDFNVCQKSKVFKDGELVPDSHVYMVKSVE